MFLPGLTRDCGGTKGQGQERAGEAAVDLSTAVST